MSDPGIQIFLSPATLFSAANARVSSTMSYLRPKSSMVAAG